MKKLLVVVDYQWDFVEGSLGFKEAIDIEDGIERRVRNYLDEGNSVLFTYDTHYEDYLETREGKALKVKHCIKNTKGHKLYGKLEKYKKWGNNTFHIEKDTFGINLETLEEFKNDVGEFDEIEFVGVVTNICVITNAILFQNLYKKSKITVNENICKSFDEELHKKAIDVMKGIFIDII